MTAEKKKRGLGRGLDSLFTDDSSTSGNEIRNIAIEAIHANPGQPRKHFNEEKLLALSETIKKDGVISPLIVVKKDGAFMIVAGERRYRASMLAGLEELPCIVKELHDDDIMTISLIENIQREDLNPIEIALGIKEILSRTGFTHEKAAAILGKSRVYVTNLLRLLTLPQVIRELIASGKLSEGHGRVMVGMKEKAALKLAEKVIERGLSVRELEEITSESGNTDHDKGRKKKKKKKDPFIKDIEKILSSGLSRDVKLMTNRSYKGEIRISFYDLDDLNGLIETLKEIEM